MQLAPPDSSQMHGLFYIYSRPSAGSTGPKTEAAEVLYVVAVCSHFIM